MGRVEVKLRVFEQGYVVRLLFRGASERVEQTGRRASSFACALSSVDPGIARQLDSYCDPQRGVRGDVCIVFPGKGKLYCVTQPMPGTGCTFDIEPFCWYCNGATPP